MLKNQLVSICMPAYNAEKYIAHAIQSVIDQTYSNWELIIVNDGSTDNTASIAECFTDKRIKLIFQNNQGQCTAANNAFKASNGLLIKFLDADDILSPETIESQVKRMNENNESVASAKWGRFYNNNLNTFKLNNETVWQDLPPDEWLVQSWKNAQPMMQCGLWLIPRNIVIKSDLWDEQLSLINDFDFFTRILVNSKMVLFTQEAVLYYRSGLEKSLSGTKTRKGYESAFRSIEKATSELLKVRGDDKAKLSCANIWQSFIYDVYPHQKDLINKAKVYIQHLTKPSVTFPCGGYSKLLLPLLGWKLTKKMQLLKYRIFLAFVK